MIQIKNLTKTYKLKKGDDVKALNGVSLDFPSNGMVFLLGKSGSGKSTLLNLIGALDSCSSGEIVFKGENTNNFTKEDFDSLRNTYIGFIFQEYNIIKEYTVGENLALALKLQGKTASKLDVENILAKVDLQGYADRNPNELSGGQLQRVSIARALIKDPEVLLADEPTGALDSGTGRQIFDLLKKLSKDKLVIIVSHDRELSESYADRIIELKDGLVIKDDECQSKSIDSDMSLSFFSGAVSVKKGYKLTDKDIQKINDYLAKYENNQPIDPLIYPKDNNLTQKNANIFTPTKQVKIDNSKSKFKLIPSKLPLLEGLKLALLSLKTKPFKLFLTLFLTVFAFTMFSFSFLVWQFDPIEMSNQTIKNEGYNFMNISWNEYEEKYDYYNYMKLSSSDVDKLAKDFNLNIFLVKGNSVNFSDNLKFREDRTQNVLYTSESTGAVVLTEEKYNTLNTLGNSKYPAEPCEIAITDYIYQSIKYYGYIDENGEEILIENYNDVIGLTLGESKRYKITAIIDTNFNVEHVKYLENYLDENGDIKIDGLGMIEYFKSYVHNLAFSDYVDCISNVFFTNNETLNVMNNNINYVVDLNRIEHNNNYRLDSAKLDCFFNFKHMAKISDVEKSQIVKVLNGKTISENNVAVSLENFIILANRNLSTEILQSIVTFTSNEGEITTDTIVNLLDKYSENNNRNLEKLIDETELLKALSLKDVSLDVSFQIYNYKIDKSDYSAKSERVKIVGIIYNYDTSLSFNERYKSIQHEIDIVGAKELFDKLEIPSEKLFDEFVAEIYNNNQILSVLINQNFATTQTKLQFNSQIIYIIEEMNEIFTVFNLIIVIFAIVLGFFAMLMLANFISTSIAYKQADIGIMRAIGGRKADVYQIFMQESLIIAIISSIITLTIVFSAVLYINNFMISTGINAQILSFNIVVVLVILAIAVFSAIISSVIPIKKFTKKTIINIIRKK